MKGRKQVKLYSGRLKSGTRETRVFQKLCDVTVLSGTFHCCTKEINITEFISETRRLRSGKIKSLFIQSPNFFPYTFLIRAGSFEILNR